MKKRGSVLATVLITATVLLILGTVVSAGVINTTKLNKKYSENIDLELAAKSGLNIIKEDFISRVKNKDIKTLSNVETYAYNINNFSKEFSENFNVNLDFENIKSFFEEYLKDDILLQVKLSVDKGNRLEIKSIAKNKGNESIKKEESQIIALSFNDSTTNEGETSGGSNSGGDSGSNDSESTDGKLVFDKLFNIGNNINSFGNNNQNAIDYFQYGSTCEVGENNKVNNEKVYPIKNPELLNLKTSINVSKILEIISNYNSNTILEHKNNESINVVDNVLKYEQLKGDNTNLKLQGSKVLFANGGYTRNENSIELLSKDGKGSELIFGGNTVFDTGMNINRAENSMFIINGNLSVNGGPFRIAESNNSVFIINGDLIQSGSSIDINLKNSIFIVAGGIAPQNNFNITLENSAFICIGDMKLNTQVNATNNGNSFIYCGNNFECNAEINIKINNGGYVPDSITVNNAINSFININYN